jgi:hypothetical protein
MLRVEEVAAARILGEGVLLLEVVFLLDPKEEENGRRNA